MLSAKRDASVAKRFFKKMMRADHRRLPFTISVDKNAAYREAFATSQKEKVLPHDCKLRRVKFLNNIIEQDHRLVKKRVRAGLGYRSFDTAERTLKGVEAMNMIRKGQVKRLDRCDAIGQAKFVESLFYIAGESWSHSQPSLSRVNLCNRTGNTHMKLPRHPSDISYTHWARFNGMKINLPRDRNWGVAEGDMAELYVGPHSKRILSDLIKRPDLLSNQLLGESTILSP